MNRKAFTLIELIGVIVLISLLALIISPAINSAIKKGKQKADEQVVENIKLAAKNWVSDNKESLLKSGEVGVKLSDLQEGGYIEKPVIRPSNNEEITYACVLVTDKSSADSEKTNYDYEFAEYASDEELDSKCNHENSVCEIVISGQRSNGWFKIGSNVNIKLIGSGEPLGLSDDDLDTDNVEAIKNMHLDNPKIFKVTKDQDYNNIIYGYVNDNNSIEKCSKSLQIDSKKPNIEIADISSTKFKIIFSDDRSGVVFYAISSKNIDVNSNSIKWKTLKNTEITVERKKTFYVYAKDRAGNIDSKKYEVDAIDSTAPSCSIKLSKAANTFGWNSTDVSVTLNKSSNSSSYGLTTTNSKNYNGQTTATATGTTTYYGWVENAENGKKATCTKTVKIDKTKPTCQAAPWTGESTTWTKNNRTITLTGTDSGSGIDPSYATKSWSFTSGTTKTKALTYTIKDKAGNSQECTRTANVYVDKTKPACQAAPWTGESTTWTKADRTIKLTGTDSGSGMDSSYTTKSWSFTSGTTKTKALTYTIKDKVGNSNECARTANVYVDKTGPVLKVTLTRADNGKAVSLVNTSWINSDLKRKMSATDSGVGLDKIQWSSDNKTWNTEANAKEHTFYEGTHNDYYRAIDKLGNASSSIHLSVKNDTSAPTFNLNGCWRSGDATKFGYSMWDNLSGISTNADKTHIKLKRYYDGNCNYSSNSSWVNVGTSSSDRNFSNGALSGSIESGVLCRQFSRTFDFYLEATDLAGNYAKSGVKSCNTYH